MTEAVWVGACMTITWCGRSVANRCVCLVVWKTVAAERGGSAVDHFTRACRCRSSRPRAAHLLPFVCRQSRR
jgi:hypothetical protein